VPDMSILDEADELVRYPATGVTVSINHHAETLGNHRVRLSFAPPVANTLRRGLSFPRLHVDGTIVNGLRIWCSERDGWAPVLAKSGAWALTLPVRRLRGREELVAAMPAEIDWDRDETGPVLLIPRLPDPLLPERVVDMLPNAAVDQETRDERQQRRRELAWQKWMVPIAVDTPQDEEATPPQATEPDDPLDLSTIAPASNDTLDLREAINMVNELVDRLGDEVALSIDERGRVVAKRRVVQFIDL
jgi:hypothetical protein